MLSILKLNDLLQTMRRSLQSFCTCAVIDADVFHMCQDVVDDPVPLFITCPAEHVISIRSAKVGSMPHGRNNGQCGPTRLTCPLSTEELDESCNERQWCTIKHVYDHYHDLHCISNANTYTVAAVTYNCIKGKWSCLLLRGFV